MQLPPLATPLLKLEVNQLALVKLGCARHQKNQTHRQAQNFPPGYRVPFLNVRQTHRVLQKEQLLV